MTEQTTGAAAETVEAVWRLESTRLIAGLVRIVRDVGLAEDLAQDALVAALDQWPRDGIPDNPGAWLMTTARRRAVDGFRRRERRDRAYQTLANDMGDQVSEQDLLAAVDHVDDDVLRLMFICCHPSLTSEAQTTLTLRLVAGLTAREIGRAYLTTEATIAQRLVRAKRTLADARAALEEPSATERAERLSAVLAVVYLMFNEGYSATAGPDWTRPTLCREALRVGRILTALVPDDPEVGGLRALMELQSSRLAARAGPNGVPILLPDQDRRRWDTGQIARGLAALARAEQLSHGEPGPYLLQAGIAACHARARTAERHRLGADHQPVRAARPPDRLGRRRGEPGGRAQHGVRTVRRAHPAGPAGRSARAARLPPAAQRPRRPPGAAGPARRGAGGVRAGRDADPQRAGAKPAARSGPAGTPPTHRLLG